MILQKIKSTKNNNIIEEYKNKVGFIISGVISGFDKGNIIFTVNGNVDMIIPSKEKIKNEKYKIGDSISGVIVGINKKQKYSPIIVSRANKLFIEELMRNEIPEINDGKIKISKIVRVPGFKTKVIVESFDSKIDAISICVGRNGSRIKNIMNEFQREKIDLIHYSENIDDIIKESLAPIKIYDIKHESDTENIFIYTDEESKKILLKKYNKNLFLTSKLIDHKIFVEKYLAVSTFEEIKEKAIKTISDNLDTSLINAMIIVNSGYTTIECIAEEDLDTFIKNCNIDEVSASGIHAAAKVVAEHF
jgi:N utilization substance protein A